MDQNPGNMSRRRTEILNKSLPRAAKYLNGRQISEILDIAHNADYPAQPTKFANFSHIRQTRDQQIYQSA